MRVLIRPDWARDSTMQRTRHTAEQIIRQLKTPEQLIAQGETVADVFPLAVAIRRGASRGDQAADSAGEGERPSIQSFWKKPSWRRQCSKTLLRETSEPETSPQRGHGPAGALPVL